MSDQLNKTPIAEPKPITTPEPGNAKPVETATPPVAVVEPAKAV